MDLALKLKLFWLVTLLPWSLTFRPLNRATCHRCHRLPFCLLSACCALPFSIRVRHGTEIQTDGWTDRQWLSLHSLCHTLWGWGITVLSVCLIYGHHRLYTLNIVACFIWCVIYRTFYCHILCTKLWKFICSWQWHILCVVLTFGAWFSNLCLI